MSQATPAAGTPDSVVGETGPAVSQQDRSSFPVAVTRHHFFMRRLHSFLGIFPIAVFVFEHLYTNASILTLNGSANYQTDVDFIWNLPGLIFLEVFGIWLPLAIHAVLGLVYTFTGRPNSTTYTYTDNRRYTWMRITGAIALVFIFVHLATTRWHWTFWGLYAAPFDPHSATITTAQAVQYGWPAALIFFIVGVLATTYHLANGLWTAAITWGLTLSVRGQRRWGWVCFILGIFMAVLWLAIIWKFATFQIPQVSALPT